MKRYLDIQAQFIDYSPSNALLILAQNSEAKKLGTAKFWKDSGAQLKADAEHIYILEKGTAYQKQDGSIATNYVPRKMFVFPNNTNAKHNETRLQPAQLTVRSGKGLQLLHHRTKRIVSSGYCRQQRNLLSQRY